VVVVVLEKWVIAEPGLLVQSTQVAAAVVVAVQMVVVLVVLEL
jgi:hypothetical protein